MKIVHDIQLVSEGRSAALVRQVMRPIIVLSR